MLTGASGDPTSRRVRFALLFAALAATGAALAFALFVASLVRRASTAADPAATHARVASGEIRGVVRFSDGSPAAGAIVRVVERSNSDIDSLLSGLTDGVPTTSDGAFRISTHGSGPFEVNATWSPPRAADGHVVQRPWRARVDASAHEDQTVLTLDEGSTVTGRAVDDRAIALREFELVVVECREIVDGDVRSWSTERHAIRGPDGRFEVRGLGAGEWELFVVAEGHAACGRERLRLPSPQSAPLTLVAPRAAAVRGVVVDPDGRPVAGALVCAHAPDERGPAFFDEREVERVAPRDPARWRADRYDRDAPRAEVLTDVRGAFELPDLSPGPCILRAVAREHAAAAPRTLDLEPGRALDGVRVELRRGASVRGTVRDPLGEPLSGIDVGVIAEGDSTWRTTGADGSFVFENVPAIDVLVAAREDLEPGEPSRLGVDAIERSFRLIEGEVAELTLGGAQPPRVRVSGSVTSNGPVARARVWFTPSRTGSEPSSARTDAAGRYAIELLRGGRCWVEIRLPSGALVEREQLVGDAEQQTIDFVLPPTQVRGRVVDAEGEPVAGALLRLRRTDLESSNGGWSTIASAEASEDGEFVLEALEPGPWRVRVTPPADDARSPRLAPRFLALDLTSVARVDALVVRLEPGGEITGTVRDTDGHPVAGARVTARGEEGLDFDHEAEAHERVTTDELGRYAIRALAPGPWRVRAVADRRASPESAPVRVDASAAAREDLVVAPAGVIEVELRDAKGNVLPHGRGEWTRVLDSDGRPWFDLERERFGAELRDHGPLPPGRWTVQRGDGTMFPAVTIDLSAGQTVRAVLQARR